MKTFLFIVGILISSAFLFSYKTKDNTAERILPYQVIAHFNCSSYGFMPPSEYVVTNIFDYDNIWMNLTGSLIDKPKVDMDKDMILGMYSSENLIDSITENYNYINVYQKVYEKRKNSGIQPPNEERIESYILIKLKYNGKGVRFIKNIQPATPSLLDYYPQ